MKRLVPHRLNGLQRLHTLATTSTAALCLALVSMTSTGYAADTPPPAKPALPSYHAASKPITDEVGNKLIIIDFVKTAQDGYPGKLTESFDPKKTRHHPQVLNLVQDYEARYGFKRAGMTSWVGASVSAFLNSQQIERLRSDTNVRLITEDEVQTLSAPFQPPPSPYGWLGAWNGPDWTEHRDWGHVATNGQTVLPGSQRKVYIIDSGVAFHDDLGSVSERYSCSTFANGGCTNTPGNVLAVGCYAHATHVAGIVGATAGNGQNRMGVYAGVNMVSMAVGSVQGALPCGTGVYQTAIGYAMDHIYWSNLSYWYQSQVVHIVTMSINSGGIGYKANGVAQTNQPKLQTLVTPGGSGWLRYPGAVFVQSAGNYNVDSCSTHMGNANDRYSAAFKTSAAATSTQDNDGVLVVGALNRLGYAAASVVSNPPPPYNNLPNHFAASEPALIAGGSVPQNDPDYRYGYGSNYGSCVDIWAPGNEIYSTFGYGNTGTSYWNTYWGGQPQAYVMGTPYANATSGWAWLSGTSMAAPHVAAAAAYIADKYNLQTPGEIEWAVRQSAQPYNYVTDPVNVPIKIVYLPD